MSEPELAGPDLWQADTMLMHAELVELELWRLRREMFADPGAAKLTVGAGQPTEQTLTGNQQDPYNGVAIFNPTSATLSIGFQAGLGVLAPAVVPAYSWACFPQRFVNLSIATLKPYDQQSTFTAPVTVLRLRVPPKPGAGLFGQPNTQVGDPNAYQMMYPPDPVSQFTLGPPPAGQAWRIRSWRSLFTTTAAVSNRVMAVAFQGGTQDVWSASLGQVATASQVIEISGSSDAPAGSVVMTTTAGGEGLTQIVHVGIPDIWITAPIYLAIPAIAGSQAGDAFTRVGAVVEVRAI